MRIALDFDGTLCASRYPEIGPVRPAHRFVLAWVKWRQRRGDLIFLWTCREGVTEAAALAWLACRGFTPDFCNQNDPALVAKYGSDSKKLSADLYVDDKNIGLLGWLLRRASR